MIPFVVSLSNHEPLPFDTLAGERVQLKRGHNPLGNNKTTHNEPNEH